MKVVVTRKIPGNGIKMLEDAGYEVLISPHDRVLERQELLNFIQGADGVLTMLTDTVDEEFINACGPNLKIVANFATGYDNFDLPALSSHNIVGTNTPEVLTEAVAEHTFALIMAVTRRIAEADKLSRSGSPPAFGPEVLLGMELKGKTLGVLGLGRIGSRVVEIGSAIGLKVIYFDNNKKNQQLEEKIGAEARDSIEAVLKEADVVSLHVPLLDSTRHLINADRLNLMKPTAYLINTSRGQVVYEEALVEALKNGSIRGAGLDVFENEPQHAPGLDDLANVVLTPHIASATIEARSAMGELAAKNIVAVLSGQPPLTPVKV
ncbi:D-glycerate dehydrogenase [Candidatus Microgenomates bacterium]|nr:D-glycerate dehydrogenase [Candidatus Microgenomates bacterium]